MRLPRVRFTIRRMMITVAVVSILVWAVKLHQIADSHRARAYRSKQHWGAAWRGMYQKTDGSYSSILGNENRDLHMFYYRSLKEKYERAARYPWISVAPDPPEPE